MWNLRLRSQVSSTKYTIYLFACCFSCILYVAIIGKFEAIFFLHLRIDDTMSLSHIWIVRLLNRAHSTSFINCWSARANSFTMQTGRLKKLCHQKHVRFFLYHYLTSSSISMWLPVFFLIFESLDRISHRRKDIHMYITWPFLSFYRLILKIQKVVRRSRRLFYFSARL